MAFIGSFRAAASLWPWRRSGREATGRSRSSFHSGARRETDSLQVSVLYQHDGGEVIDPATVPGHVAVIVLIINLSVSQSMLDRKCISKT